VVVTDTRVSVQRTIRALLVLAHFIVLAVSMAGTACSGSASGKPNHPDSGYGKEIVTPSSINCTDFCNRMGDCAAHLCTEDTGSAAYAGISGLVVQECGMTCVDSQLSAKMTKDQWTCLFQSSCREVFDYDNCHANSSYYCQ